MSNPFDGMTADQMKKLMQDDPAKFKEMEKETEVAISDPNAPRVFRNGRLISGPAPAKE